MLPRAQNRGRKPPRPSRWLAVLLLLMGLIGRPARAVSFQEETQAEPSRTAQAEEPKRTNPALPRISMDTQTGTPGTNVVIPLYYSPPQGAELRSVSVEIEWVSKNLQFFRSERGIAAEAIGADVSAKVVGTRKGEKDLEYSTLRIDASVVEEDPKRGMPEGLLAYLTFKISPEAQAFAIELRPKLISATVIGPAGRKITQAEVANGKVNVELPGLPPYVTCFFFSH